MSFQPDKITKEHVLKAVQLIEKGDASPKKNRLRKHFDFSNPTGFVFVFRF